MHSVRDDHTHLRIDPQSYLDAPFFHARKVGDGVETRGESKKELGCKIPGPEGNGVYAEWKWNGEELSLRTDRLGMYPIFYFGSDNILIVSTSIFKILSEGVTPEINWPALAVFLRTGSFIGTDTAFTGIQGLPPNTRLEWRPGKLNVSGNYWFVTPREPCRATVVDEYIDAFRQAIARRMPENVFAMPLSGGRDSRHILFALSEAGRIPKYVTTSRRFPPERTIDERVASEVAAEIGVPHIIVGPPKAEVPSYIAANVITNMTAPRRGWKFSYVKKLWESVKTSYDGIGGDMLSGGSALRQSNLNLLQSGKIEAFCRSTFSNEGLEVLIPKEQFCHLSTEVAIEHMLPEVEKHLEAANPVTSFYFWNRTRRFDSTNPFGMLLTIPVVHAPFLDLDLYELLASLPASFNLGGWLHDEVIAKAYPKYAHIPFEPKNPAIAKNPVRMRKTTWDLGRYLASEQPNYLLRPAFYLPRLIARALAFGHSGRGLSIPYIVYLTQLESILTRGLPVSKLGAR